MESKSKTKLPGLGFGQKKCGSNHFWAKGTLFGWSTLCLRLWEPAIGHGIKGGWLEPKWHKLSFWGSFLANKTQGTLVLGRGDLGGAKEAMLSKCGGGSLADMQGGIWFDSPVSFSILTLFPTLYSPLPSLILHPNSPESSGGLCINGMWWWVVVEEKRLVAASPKSL